MPQLKYYKPHCGDSEMASQTLPFHLYQFVDLCILLGCDYCEKIGGLGPKRALSLIKQHRTIECVAQNVNKKVFAPNWANSIALLWAFDCDNQCMVSLFCLNQESITTVSP